MEHELRELFPEIREDDLRRAASRFSILEISRGYPVIEEGEEDAGLMFILDGRVTVDTASFEVATIGPGGILGEIGAFGAQQRIANVCTVDPTVFLVIERRDYDVLAREASPVAFAIERMALLQTASRLRTLDVRIGDLAQEEAGAEGPDHVRELDPALCDVPADLEVVECLSASRLFEGAPAEALVVLSRHLRPIGVDSGQVLCAQGCRGDHAYILAEGSVEVRIGDGEGAQAPVAELGPGDAVGIASMVDDRPRMATCVAVEACSLLAIERSSCERLVNLDGRVGSVFRGAMVRALGEQISYANAQFARLSLKRQKLTGGVFTRVGVED